MPEVMTASQAPGWVLHHEGYSVLTESGSIPLCPRQRICRHARRSLGQPRPDVGGLARLFKMGILAALLRGRPF